MRKTIRKQQWQAVEISYYVHDCFRVLPFINGAQQEVLGQGAIKQMDSALSSSVKGFPYWEAAFLRGPSSLPLPT